MVLFRPVLYLSNCPFYYGFKVTLDVSTLAFKFVRKSRNNSSLTMNSSCANGRSFSYVIALLNVPGSNEAIGKKKVSGTGDSHSRMPADLVTKESDHRDETYISHPMDSNLITSHRPVNVGKLLEKSAVYTDLLAGCLETDWAALPYPQPTVKVMLSSGRRSKKRRLLSHPATGANRYSLTAAAGAGRQDQIEDPAENNVPSDELLDDDGSTELNANDTTALLFPGQGSQFVGMGRQLAKYPNVAQLYGAASEILGYDLFRLCTEGPKAELDRTIATQPAVFVTSLAAVERLREEFPMAIENCVAAAGFSVGEYAALVFGGALSFEEAVGLVKLRAQLMQTASEAVPSGMMTVFESAGSRLWLACDIAREFAKTKGVANPVCQICSHLYTQTKVIGGHEVCLSFVQRNAAEFQLRASRMKRLAVSGAFHTPLMDSAVEPLKEALSLANLTAPLIDVYSNVDGLPYDDNMRQMRRKLTKQVARAVKWEQVIHRLFDSTKAQYPKSYEVGPGRQLGAMLKGANGKAFRFYTSIGV